MPTNTYEVYFPVLIQLIVAAGLAAGLVGGGLLLGKRVRNAAKNMPYESGMQPIGTARERFSVKFYLVAMVFILFDIEAIFLYPWAIVFRELAHQNRLFPFVEMLLFIVLVLAGFFYIWKKGVLDWSQEAMEAFRTPRIIPGEEPAELAGLGSPDRRI